MEIPDPWEWLASMGDVCLLREPIRERGRYYHSKRVIVVRKGLPIAEERAVLWHELVHADRGDEACTTTSVVEASVDREAARRAMPWPVLRWGLDAATSDSELVELMKVDERLVKVRFDCLHPAERAYVARRRIEFQESA
jgi:hypothetical protein